MVTQHGLPKGRNGIASGTTTTSSTTSTTNPNPIATNSPAGIRIRTSQSLLNGHQRAPSEFSLASPSPSPTPRRNSLPGNTLFPGDDGDNDDDEDDEGHLDSHITFLDSLDLDSSSTVDNSIVDSTVDSAVDNEGGPSPRIKRLCSDRRHRVATPVTQRGFDRHRRQSSEEHHHPRRAVSAQSGRSVESRQSTGSIREEQNTDGEEEQEEQEEEEEAEEGVPPQQQQQQQQQRPAPAPPQERGKGPIMGLTATNPARRRHRVSLSADLIAAEKEVEEEVTGNVGISAWRRKRLAEAAAVAAAAAGTEAAKAAGAGRKTTVRSLSAEDYNREERVKGKGVLEEITSTNGQRTGGGGGLIDSVSNGYPGRMTARRVMSMSAGAGTGTARPTGGLGLGLGPKRTEGPERSGSPEKGKGRGSPPLVHGQGAKGEVTQPASEAGRAAIAREEARRLRAGGGSTTTTTTTAAAAPGPSGSGLGSGSGSVAPRDPKDRPLSSTSLRANLQRSSPISNSPVKAKLSSYSSLASPSRAKSGLSNVPASGHGRTRSAVGPGTLQRSTSAASNTSAMSASASTTTSTSALAAPPVTSRHQRSNSGASSSTSAYNPAAAATRKDPVMRNSRDKDLPKLRNFKPAEHPSPIKEVSHEDISRRAAMLQTPEPSLDDIIKPSSRPSSSHSAIYSPIDPPPESTPAEQAAHQRVLEQLANLRKISRISPPASNRSSWSTESAENENENDEPKLRVRRRSTRHRKLEDAANPQARVDEIFAEIDSLERNRSSARLARSKSLDDSFIRGPPNIPTETTPPRPRSAGRTMRDPKLVTPIRLFSPDSEMGEFTARLLRSPAVEDYEDLLALDSDKEGDDSILPLRVAAAERKVATTSIEELINAPRPPREVVKREIIKTSRPRKEILKTAVVTSIGSKPTVKYPKRSILEDDSDDSLDYLISNDQDFSALLRSEDSDGEDAKLSATENKYAPEETAGLKVRSKDEARIADKEREKERAVHEKLMNRLKTLQLEVRSATRGIEVLEQWLGRPGGSDNTSSSDIMEHITEHEALLYRLRLEEVKQRERLELRILEQEAHRGRPLWKKSPRWLQWFFIGLMLALIWYGVESAILYVHPLPSLLVVPS